MSFMVMSFEGTIVIRAHQKILDMQKEFSAKCDENSIDRVAFLIIRLWFFFKVEFFSSFLIFLILMALALIRYILI